ncbi:MAG: hypothetical protein JWN76_471 [Chitinophagaceae bacterium]|nr:hypothetical protein [Chitinophagaceae bacterium]
MPNWLYESLGFTNIFPFILALVYFRMSPDAYRPFFFLVWLGALNDWFSFLLFHYFHTANFINSGIYALFDFLLIIWLFHNWNKRKSKMIFYLGIAGVVIWAVDNLVMHSLRQINSLFRVYYALIIIYLVILEITEFVFTRRINLLKDSRFIICCGFLFFYSFRAFFETFYLIKLPLSNEFYAGLFYILVAVNAVCNLIYAYAILCLKQKEKYTLSYS